MFSRFDITPDRDRQTDMLQQHNEPPYISNQ